MIENTNNIVRKKIAHGSLFSGIGGFDLAAEWMGWENKFHCEWNEFGQKVLKYYWPNATSYGDITKTDFNVWRGKIDVLSGGFPCQDASQAKQDIQGRKGLQGTRTGLFWSMCRAIREIKPKYVVAENVANLLKINKGEDFRTILSEVASMGYNAEWRICRANEQGAPHKRERLYLVAYSNSIRLNPEKLSYPMFGRRLHRGPGGLSEQLFKLFGAVPGKVNPQFLAWMMGYPLKWLEKALNHSETQ